MENMCFEPFLCHPAGFLLQEFLTPLLANQDIQELLINLPAIIKAMAPEEDKNNQDSKEEKPRAKAENSCKQNFHDLLINLPAIIKAMAPEKEDSVREPQKQEEKLSPEPRPQENIQKEEEIIPSVSTDNDQFTITLNLKKFRPDDISVKIVPTKNLVIVEAVNQNQMEEAGAVSRPFIKKFGIPDGYNMDKMESKLSSDGVLTVMTPRIVPPAESGRNIPIQFLDKQF